MNDYFVLYGTEKEQFKELKDRPEGMRIYSNYQGFDCLEEANEFALRQIAYKPILARNLLESLDFAKEDSAPYLVVLYYASKYWASGYDNDSPIPVYEVTRCPESELEAEVMRFAEGGPNKIYAGIELKLKPVLNVLLS